MAPSTCTLQHSFRSHISPRRPRTRQRPIPKPSGCREGRTRCAISASRRHRRRHLQMVGSPFGHQASAASRPSIPGAGCRRDWLVRPARSFFSQGAFRPRPRSALPCPGAKLRRWRKQGRTERCRDGERTAPMDLPLDGSSRHATHNVAVCGKREDDDRGDDQHGIRSYDAILHAGLRTAQKPGDPHRERLRI